MDLNMCRVCRQSDDEESINLLSIDDLLDEESNLTILESMTVCSGSEISKADGLPYFICDFCLDELKITYIFLQKLQESTEILTKQLESNPPIKDDEHELKDDSSRQTDSPEASTSEAHETDEPQEQIFEFVFDDENDGNKTDSEELNVEELEEENKSYEEYDVLDGEEGESEAIDEENRLEYEIEYRDVPEHTPTTYEELEIAGNEEVVTMSGKPDEGTIIRNVRGGYLMELEDGSFVFRCDSCEKTFKKADYLSNHVRFVHKKVRPYPCSVCSKRY